MKVGRRGKRGNTLRIQTTTFVRNVNPLVLATNVAVASLVPRLTPLCAQFIRTFAPLLRTYILYVYGIKNVHLERERARLSSCLSENKYLTSRTINVLLTAYARVTFGVSTVK